MIASMAVLFTLVLSQMTLDTPRQPVRCLRVCAIEDTRCRVEDLCSSERETDEVRPEAGACMPTLLATRMPAVAGYRRRLPEVPERCEAPARVLEARAVKWVWIDYEAEGRHGNRGVRWRVELEPPYKLERYEAPGYILTGDARVCGRSAPGTIRVIEPQGTARCCVRGYLRGQILKQTTAIAAVTVRIDGRLEPEQGSTVTTSQPRGGRSVPDPQRYCWPEGRYTTRALGEPPRLRIAGVTRVPDIPAARQPATASPEHAKRCRKEGGEFAVPHYLELQIRFKGGATLRTRIPFCVVDFDKIKKP